MKRNLVTALLLLPVMIAIKMIDNMPWWSFVPPVFAIGILIGMAGWNVSCFYTGFLTGFILWIGAILYFHFTYNGWILLKFPAGARALILLVAGLTGGLPTGLALYAGKWISFAAKNKSTH